MPKVIGIIIASVFGFACTVWLLQTLDANAMTPQQIEKLAHNAPELRGKFGVCVRMAEIAKYMAEKDGYIVTYGLEKKWAWWHNRFENHRFVILEKDGIKTEILH